VPAVIQYNNTAKHVRTMLHGMHHVCFEGASFSNAGYALILNVCLESFLLMRIIDLLFSCGEALGL
jgi:hypothetical protein